MAMGEGTSNRRQVSIGRRSKTVHHHDARWTIRRRTRLPDDWLTASVPETIVALRIAAVTTVASNDAYSLPDASRRHGKRRRSRPEQQQDASPSGPLAIDAWRFARPCPIFGRMAECVERHHPEEQADVTRTR
ncbi:hypothetical protein [Burkholderia ubonensis]|uniref:hypothetical protein n=1 Tax=Burkholderia ubonensis TaxID=101571 RepID=UPI0018DFDDD8|nr:hypothetical protein [Burkholderia ubonensis]